ncbi:MAG: hypothetical protein U0163_06495 [Gemmatimonadaceae bacterium]
MASTSVLATVTRELAESTSDEIVVNWAFREAQQFVRLFSACRRVGDDLVGQVMNTTLQLLTAPRQLVAFASHALQLFALRPESLLGRVLCRQRQGEHQRHANQQSLLGTHARHRTSRR